MDFIEVMIVFLLASTGVVVAAAFFGFSSRIGDLSIDARGEGSLLEGFRLDFKMAS
jgi:hypothetical protein